MKLSMFIVDAFAERPLTGNPAAVCPLETWLPATMMQAIASEMNLSETVFFAPDPGRDTFGIRWFTPTREVELIGHATLAAGHLVLERMRPHAASVRFVSNDDEFVVTRDGGSLALEMPALRPQPIQAPAALLRGLGRRPKAVLAAKHYLCVFDHPDDVAALAPNMGLLAELELPAVIVTACAVSGADLCPDSLRPRTGCPKTRSRGWRTFVSRPIGPSNSARRVLLGFSSRGEAGPFAARILVRG